MTNKVTEYQQVAAILAMDINVLAGAAEFKKDDPEFLLGLINRLKEDKDKLINDPEAREMRYNSMCQIFSIPKE